MKKMTAIISLLLIFTICTAPEFRALAVLWPEVINYYDPLVRAVTAVEVGDGSDLYNEKEDAVGYFQIRPVRVEHYNKLRGTDYKLEDFYDYDLSREMFLYYAHGKTYERAAKDWNGSGHKTIEYWNKVRARL
jgi:hypothetical protein